MFVAVAPFSILSVALPKVPMTRSLGFSQYAVLPVMLIMPELNLSVAAAEKTALFRLSVPPLRLIVPESYILRCSVALTMPPVSMLSVPVPPCAVVVPPTNRFALSHVALLSDTVVVELDPA